MLGLSRFARSFAFLAISVALVLAAATYLWRTLNPPEPPTIAPLVQLEKMGTLVSLRINYADVKPFVSAKDVSTLFGNVELGRTELLLVARGECTIGPNLANATLVADKHTQGMFHLTLPPPRTVNASINHGLSKVWNGSTHRLDSLFNSDRNMQLAIDAAYADAEADIRRTCRSPAYVNQAKKYAEEVLKAMYAGSGQTLSIEWSPS